MHEHALQFDRVLRLEAKLFALVRLDHDFAA
jgi:hypothetical protein